MKSQQIYRRWKMINHNFKELVNQGNIEEVRKELLAIFNSNPDLGNGEFREYYHYAKENLGGRLFDVSSDFEILQDKSQWTTSYVAKIFLALRKSFAKELVEHLMTAAPYVYGTKAKQQDMQWQTQENTKEQNQSRKPEEKKYLTMGVCLVVAVVLLLIVMMMVIN